MRPSKPQNSVPEHVRETTAPGSGGAAAVTLRSLERKRIPVATTRPASVVASAEAPEAEGEGGAVGAGGRGGVCWRRRRRAAAVAQQRTARRAPLMATPIA